MTDTDKLKRLAEAMVNNCQRGIKMDRELTEATGILILALIAENERFDGIATDLQSKHDVAVMRLSEAVAMLREIYKDRDNLTDSMDASVSAFLARIDAKDTQ